MLGVIQLIVINSKIFIRSFKIFSEIVYSHIFDIYYNIFHKFSFKKYIHILITKSIDKIIFHHLLPSLHFHLVFQASSMFLYFPLAAYF